MDKNPHTGIADDADHPYVRNDEVIILSQSHEMHTHKINNSFRL